MPPTPHEMTKSTKAMRILMIGATGTAGRATTDALLKAGHNVTCLVRDGTACDDLQAMGAHLVRGEVTDANTLTRVLPPNAPFDAVVSCLASRTGLAQEAWAIDYAAHAALLSRAREAGIAQMVLLSAICVQKPELPFQFAKLKFEEELIASGLTYSIVRPTAFFKSLSGQIARVASGKPFVMFGDGTLTRCKPISDRDLGRYMANCLHDQALQNRILPIGGPGPAITPRAQGEMLFELTSQRQSFRPVPLALMNAIISGLTLLGRVHAASARKAELARIGRYYGTQSMLLWDEAAGRYDADATPSFGTDHLRDYYAAVIAGKTAVDLGDHAVF